MRLPVAALAVGFGLAGLPAPAPAAFVTYTFDGPEFPQFQTTPLLDRAPNAGDPTFRTSFTSAPTGGGFQVVPAAPIPIFSGPFLADPFPPVDDLVLTFGAPVDSLTVDFVTNGPGRLELTTPAGGTSAASGDVGGPVPGGTLTFSSPTPFTTATLRAFNPGNVRIEFAIDDLVLNTAGAAAVPEPGSLALLGVGLTGVAARRRLRRA